MRDLEAEIELWHRLYVTIAVTEIAARARRTASRLTPPDRAYSSIAKVLPSGSLNQATLPSSSSWIPL
jgi:hypothetical protein